MAGQTLKIISWNVNGIRAVLKKGFTDFLEAHKPDVLCIQEIKACKDIVGKLDIPYPYTCYHSAKRKGYSGTAIFAKKKPESVVSDFSVDLGIEEGRVQAVDMGKFFIVNVYTPNSKGQLERLDYRYNEWEPSFRQYLNNLQKTKPVILCGDLNVAHKEIDLANPEGNRRNPGFTDEERHRFGELLDSGFVDSFRHFHPDAEERYSWWSYRTYARERNVGWRIDYCLVSPELTDSLKSAFILDDVHGSDHCPVGITLEV